MISFNYNRKKLVKDIVISCIIVFLPFAFYVYTFAPKDQKTWTTNWFTLDAGWFAEINYFLWVLSYKLLILSVLSIWYVTCRNWWRALIFVPIVYEIYKFCDFIYEAYNLTGEFGFILSIPISIVYISLLMFLAVKLSYYKMDRTDTHKLNLEIIETYNKISKYNNRDFKQIKKELLLFRKQKKNMPKKEYLTKLISLRDRLTVD